MRWGVAAAILAAALLAVSAAPAQPRPLTIAAAADLEPVLPALLKEFQSRTGIPTVAVYASSATLAMQIINGGPYDLMLAADLSFPEKVIAAGRGESAKPIPYARGTLVLWARKDSPLCKRGSETAGLSVEAMRSPALHKLAVADASHAPYGRAAMAAIAKLGLTQTLMDKLVVAENIAQAAQFAESGNAQAGLISLTSALTPRLESTGSYIRLPPQSYPPILQGAVIVKGARHPAEARHFLNFLLSPDVGKQLAARGLREP